MEIGVFRFQIDYLLYCFDLLLFQLNCRLPFFFVSAFDKNDWMREPREKETVPLKTDFFTQCNCSYLQATQRPLFSFTRVFACCSLRWLHFFTYRLCACVYACWLAWENERVSERERAREWAAKRLLYVVGDLHIIAVDHQLMESFSMWIFEWKTQSKNKSCTKYDKVATISVFTEKELMHVSLGVSEWEKIRRTKSFIESVCSATLTALRHAISDFA